MNIARVIKNAAGIFATLLLFATAQAEPQSVRWTYKDDANADFAHVVEVVNAKTGAALSTSDFMMYEDRALATSRFRMYVQTAGGLPVQGMSIRVWANLETGKAIQVEAAVESKPTLRRLASSLARFGSNNLNSAPAQKRMMSLVHDLVGAHQDDPFVRVITHKDVFEGGKVVRVFTVKAKRGTHVISISPMNLKVMKNIYREFPQFDPASNTAPSAAEFSIPAMVFPMYEETATGVPQPRVLAQLKRLKAKVPRVSQDPYTSLRTRKYFTNKSDAILGWTAEGQAAGYWSMPEVKSRAERLRTSLPTVDNSFAAGGIILDGRYATVSLHPDAAAKFPGLSFKPEKSAQFFPVWVEANIGGKRVYEMIPGASLLGRPLRSFEESFQRVARRLKNHDAATYINDGFDEIQVYYAIDVLMESLHGMGFTDPELSTRPFNAFLYDPDIAMRDNAYYTDDTINFTTYSPNQQNYARDNSTIWHELGHGIMDRMMGDVLTLNDTGGLSEGMADFLAALVTEKLTNAQPFPGKDEFRIVNKTGFFLTNEVHDDGEAYGGAMYDLMLAAQAKLGIDGVVKVTDLTMEAMRLSRNHPGLTASDWFNRMLFADELGHEPVRKAGELGALIQQALAGRNFSFDGKGIATFELKHEGVEVDPSAAGSRGSPIPVSLKKGEKATYTVKVKAKGTAAYPFTYPLTVKVGLRGGPLQGGVKWDGEENSPLVFTLQSETDEVSIPLTANGECDEVNREDGSCVDFAYIQLWPKGSAQPVAKKRFYLRVKPLQ